MSSSSGASIEPPKPHNTNFQQQRCARLSVVVAVSPALFRLATRRCRFTYTCVTVVYLVCGEFMRAALFARASACAAYVAQSASTVCVCVCAVRACVCLLKSGVLSIIFGVVAYTASEGVKVVIFSFSFCFLLRHFSPSPSCPCEANTKARSGARPREWSPHSTPHPCPPLPPFAACGIAITNCFRASPGTILQRPQHPMLSPHLFSFSFHLSSLSRVRSSSPVRVCACPDRCSL